MFRVESFIGRGGGTILTPDPVTADRRNPLPHLFPFLLAAGTVLYLAAENPYEGLSVGNLRDPLVLALVYVLLVWAVTSLFVRDRLRRSLIAMVVGLPPLVSGYLFGWLRGLSLEPALRGGIELGLLFIAMVIGLRITLRVPWTKTAARFLNVFSILLVVLAVPGILRLAGSVEGASGEAGLSEVAGPRPDIYLVVLDAYTGSESLADIYGFDNSSIHDSLRARGFVLPSRPRSNYTSTFLSVGSMLNRDYVNELAEQTRPDYRDRSTLYHKLEFSRTVKDLKGLGYTFGYVGSSYPPMASNRLADTQYSEVPSREFERLWTRMTVLPALLAMACPSLASCVGSALHFGPESAAETEDRLKFLRTLIQRPGPKFVYAHWLLPHGPFRFDSECRHIAPEWTTGSIRIENDSVARQRYLDQLTCTNAKILEFVDAVRSASADSTIIILQADHGDGRFPGGRPSSRETAAPDQIRERFDVFAAYSGPGGIGDSLAAQQTPVNIFRTIVRVLWDFDEPPLEDRHYWSGKERPLQLVPVNVDSLWRDGAAHAP